MVVNGVSPASQTDTSFVFAEPFALDTGVTSFSMSLDYRYTDQETLQTRDTTVAVALHVKRQAEATAPQGVHIVCGSRALPRLPRGETTFLRAGLDLSMRALSVRWCAGNKGG